MSPISSSLSFKNIKVIGEFEIESCNIELDLVFQNTEFCNKFKLVNTKLKKPVIFHNKCIFNSEAIFSLSTFSDSVILGNSEFKRDLPDFREASYKKCINVDEIKIHEKTLITKVDTDCLNNHENETEHVARFLKTLSINSNNHFGSLKYFAIESQAKAATGTPSEKVTNFFYKSISNYGRSISRPFFAWLSTNFIFAFIYYAFLLWHSAYKSFYHSEIINIFSTLRCLFKFCSCFVSSCIFSSR